MMSARRPQPRRPPATAAGLALACALAAWPSPAPAAPRCESTVMSGLAFGSYDVLSSIPLTATGRIRIICPKGQSTQITISRGNSSTFAWREMRSGSDVLRYNVYLDPAMTMVWGDGTDGSSIFSIIPGGNDQIPIYGRVPAGQDVSAGSYTDTLVVTVFL